MGGIGGGDEKNRNSGEKLDFGRFWRDLSWWDNKIAVWGVQNIPGSAGGMLGGLEKIFQI